MGVQLEDDFAVDTVAVLNDSPALADPRHLRRPEQLYRGHRMSGDTVILDRVQVPAFIDQLGERLMRTRCRCIGGRGNRPGPSTAPANLTKVVATT